VNSAGNAFVILLDKGASPASLEQLERQLCGGRVQCRLLGWTIAQQTPNAFPIDEDSLATMSYAYIRSTGTGLERSLFNCREYVEVPKDRCMKERTPAPAQEAEQGQSPSETQRQGTETVRIR
jgi:hypothetical protein